MQYLYNIVAILLVIVATPVLIYRAIREDGFVERVRQSIFGQVPQDDVDRVAGKNCIWLHAASVGEIVAASPLVKEFHKEFPRRPILVSVVTSSGYDMAKRILKDADSIIYFPMDLPFLGERVIKRIRPGVFMPVETELWPNFLKAIRKYKIPAMMVNGRISDKSVKRYHYLRGLLKDMLGTIDKFCMQSPIDAQYIIQLGADPSLVTVTGNTRHGIATKEYLEIKASAGNITVNGAVSDAMHIGQYFLMKGGKVTLSGQGGDALQVEPKTLDDDITEDPEKENNGLMFIQGGSIDIVAAAADTKGIKAPKDLYISGGTFNITASGDGTRGISVGGNLIVSEDHNTTLIQIRATGTDYEDPVTEETKRCMGIKVDGDMTVHKGTIRVSNTGVGTRGIRVNGTYTNIGGTVQASIKQGP